MKTTEDKTKHQAIEEWLMKRGISKEVLRENNIHFDGEKIVIPVYNRNSVHLFNKYRADPFEYIDGPKYQYDKGAYACLYGIHKPLGQMVVICEGEFDALLVESLGLSAVTSTGGSQSFRPEWKKELEGKSIFICYDNDDAGLKGAVQLQILFPDARFVFIPREPGVKDITEFIAKYGTFAFKKMVYDAPNYPLIDDFRVPDTKKDYQKIIKQFKALAESYLEQQREAQADRKPWEHLNAFREFCVKKYEEYEMKLKKFEKVKAYKQDDGLLSLEDARKIPISHFMKINKYGYMNCLWHNDSTPSLKYYEADNHLYCFGCEKYADVIDVVMQQQDTDFKSALTWLSEKYGKTA